MAFRSWQELAREPAAERHVVQMYRDERFLLDAVTAWIAPALLPGAAGAALLLGTPPHLDAVRERLRADGFDVAALESEGRLRLCDGLAFLDLILRDGMPDPDAFQTELRRELAPVRAAAMRGGAAHEVRAWGEMVDTLWKRGQKDAAKRLEALWNEAIDGVARLRLLCSYEVDNLAPETYDGSLRDLCDCHSQLIPERDYARFDAAVGEALVAEFGEADAGMARLLLAKRRSLPIGMPPAEAVLVALHEAQPDVARRVLRATRARLDRVDAG